MSVPPIVIRFMLACFTNNDPEQLVRPATWNSEAGRDARQWLKDNGLIDADHKATKRGKFWVEDICATPLRIQTTTWTLPPRQATVEEGWPNPIQQAAE